LSATDTPALRLPVVALLSNVQSFEPLILDSRKPSVNSFDNSSLDNPNTDSKETSPLTACSQY